MAKRVYTKPQLRERLKNRIKAGRRGGPKNKWTLRKAAVLKHDYEAAGGGYTSGTRTKSQREMKRRLRTQNERRRKSEGKKRAA